MTARALGASVVVGLLATCCTSSPPVNPSTTSTSSSPSVQATSPADTAAIAAARLFLRRYVRSDGRVVRLDQGGDTVSEGQAYAMLLSVAIGDAARFKAAWSWARAHLQRPDSLLSWHWVNGSVADPQSAADADVVAAWALTVAFERFHIASYGSAARAIMAGVLSKETVAYAGGRLLVAGPWATAQPATVDPSYLMPTAFTVLQRIDPQSADLETASTRALQALTARAPHLPPDWAALSGPTLRAASSPDKSQSPRYGWDAVRVPLWVAVSCRAQDRAIAAAMWPFLERATGGTLASVYSLDGTPLDRNPSAESVVAAASAARAAGVSRAVSTLLAKAQMMNSAQPRYYASALVALGRVFLTTELLNPCA